MQGKDLQAYTVLLPSRKYLTQGSIYSALCRSDNASARSLKEEPINGMETRRTKIAGSDTCTYQGAALPCDSAGNELAARMKIKMACLT
jgi:hypothetical protein